MDESLDTREFLLREILCAKKSIKDFSYIQKTGAVTNHAPQKLIVFEGRQESELAKILEVLRQSGTLFF